MKTQDELNDLKIEYESLTSKLKELTDDELMQVAGGYRRTDDPEQTNACKCINIARSNVSESTTLPENVKIELENHFRFVFDGLVRWVVANPFELIPIVNEIIEKLEPYKNYEKIPVTLEKLNEALVHLNNLKD